MGIVRRSVENRTTQPNGVVGPESLTKSQIQGRYCFDNFSQEPFSTKTGALAAPAGTALQACLVNTGRNVFLWATTADETDEFYPTLATDGGYNFQIAATPVLADGIEVNFGGDGVSHPRNFIPSTENWFARVLLNVTDASGADIFFGVKKVAATVATLTEVTDVFGVRILGDSSSTTGAFTIITNLNNSGSTDYTSTATSITALEDLTAVELEIRAINGKGYVYVNGVDRTVVTYTFDSGDVVAAIGRFIQTTDTSAAVKVFGFESGPLEDRAPETLANLVSATT